MQILKFRTIKNPLSFLTKDRQNYIVTIQYKCTKEELELLSNKMINDVSTIRNSN